MRNLSIGTRDGHVVEANASVRARAAGGAGALWAAGDGAGGGHERQIAEAAIRCGAVGAAVGGGAGVALVSCLTGRRQRVYGRQAIVPQAGPILQAASRSTTARSSRYSSGERKRTVCPSLYVIADSNPTGLLPSIAGTIVTVISSPALRAFGPSLRPSLEMA